MIIHVDPLTALLVEPNLLQSHYIVYETLTVCYLLRTLPAG